jgi:hypothetical protein
MEILKGERLCEDRTNVAQVNAVVITMGRLRNVSTADPRLHNNWVSIYLSRLRMLEWLKSSAGFAFYCGRDARGAAVARNVDHRGTHAECALGSSVGHR